MVNGAFINQLTYGLCYVTNGSNIIPDTISAGNAPGGGPQGAGFSSVKWSVQVNVPSLAPIGLIQNGAPGFDMAYAGIKAVFPTVFNASSGFTTFFRLVNTGLGNVPVYAILIKDQQAGLTNTRTPLQAGNATPITTLGSWGATYVRADDIATALGTTLGSTSTIILLSPQPSLGISRFGIEPTGDFIITAPGI